MADLVRPAPSLRSVADRLAQARAVVGLLAFAAMFAVLIFVVETLSLLGVPDRILVWMIVAFALALPALAAIPARTVSLTEFAVAGRGLRPAENAASASTGMLGAVFTVGLAAAFLRGEAEMSALAIGMTGGLLVGGVLIAPYVRRGARQSLGDFLAARFGGRVISGLAGVIVVATLLPLLVAELYLAARIGSWTLGVTTQTFVVIAAVLVLVPPLLGGLRAVTVSGVVQFVLLFATLVFACIWISLAATGNGSPLAGYLTASANLQAAGVLNDELKASAGWKMAGLGLCVTLGIAALPTLLMRSAAARSTQSSRSAVARTLLAAGLVVLACASIAAAAKWIVEDSPRRHASIAELVAQPWIVSWVARGETLVTLCGAPASEAGSSCTAETMKRGDLAVDPQIALLAAPGIAGQPALVGMLVAAGCLAAAIAAGSLSLLGISQAFGHDLLFRACAPRMSASRRLLLQRLVLLGFAVLAARAALAPPADFLTLALVSLSLAASGLFPALLIAVWWRRANRAGAIAGMLAGFAIAAYLTVAAIYAPQFVTWLEPAGLAGLARDLGAERIALVAAPAGLFIAVLGSLVTRPPGPDERAFAGALLGPRDLSSDDETGQLT